MKVLLLNCSPRRNSNTSIALEAVRKGLAPRHEVELIDVAKAGLRGCLACDGCRRNGGICVQPDGGAALLEKIVAADCIIFGSPVYWMGISAQGKALLDRFYAVEEALHKAPKKLGIVTVGAAGTGDGQYDLISGQFREIADFLHWELVLDARFSGWEAGAISADQDGLRKLTETAAGIR